MPLFGPPNVQKLKSRLDIRGLIKALDYTKKIEIQREAVKALGALRAEASIEPLISQLEDENCEYQALVISALGEIKAEDAVPSLLSRLRKQGASASAPELTALQNIGQPAAAPLLDVLRDNAQDMKQSLALIRTLEALGGDSVSDGFQELISARFPSLIVPLAEALIRKNDTRVIQRLADVLSTSPGETWSARVAAILEELGWIPSGESQEAANFLAKREWNRLAELGEPAVLLLNQHLTTGPVSEIGNAAETLGQIGDERAVDPIAALLNHRRPEIAVTAARALGEIGSSQSVEILLQTSVDSDSKSLQAEVERSLAKIGSSAVKPLIDQLNSSDPQERKTAVRILGEIGDRRALDFLISAQDDPSLQPELDAALDQLGWEPHNGQ